MKHCTYLMFVIGITPDTAAIPTQLMLSFQFGGNIFLECKLCDLLFGQKYEMPRNYGTSGTLSEPLIFNAEQ